MLTIASIVAAAFVAAPLSATRPGTVVTTVAPANGATVSGTVTWHVRVEGRKPRAIEFAIDGARVARDSTAPYEARIDTSRLANGRHTLRATARVPGTTVPAVTSVTVANATTTPPPPAPEPSPPASTSQPSFAGSASVGSTLSGSMGTWSGSTPMTHSPRWLRCDPAGTGCAPITGATDDAYVVVSADVGRTLRLSVEASNAAGSSTATSAASDVVPEIALPPPTPSPTPACAPPYSDASPWNTPIGASPAVVATSASFLGVLGDDTFTSQPLHYAYPVYTVDASTPSATIVVRNTFNDVSQGGTALTKRRDGHVVSLRLPSDARPSEGTDGHLIVVDRATGDEWGFWQAARDASGQWSATNGYHYNTSWSGVPPSGFGSRGAGVTYLAGLIRSCEVAQGRIDHALAFAYNYPKNTFVYPATKSDGLSTSDPNLPEGARLQLDPTLTETTIASWGCAGACLTVARALQRYGMYLVDNSGRDKIYTEDESTARWSGTMTGSTLSVIPKRHLRWVAPPG